jgi:hypothetical protein
MIATPFKVWFAQLGFFKPQGGDDSVSSATFL